MTGPELRSIREAYGRALPGFGTALIADPFWVGRSELRDVSAEKLGALGLDADDTVIALDHEIKVWRCTLEASRAFALELEHAQPGYSCKAQRAG